MPVVDLFVIGVGGEDLAAERELLASKVYPRLIPLCASRGWDLNIHDDPLAGRLVEQQAQLIERTREFEHAVHPVFLYVMGDYLGERLCPPSIPGALADTVLDACDPPEHDAILAAYEPDYSVEGGVLRLQRPTEEVADMLLAASSLPGLSDEERFLLSASGTQRELFAAGETDDFPQNLVVAVRVSDVQRTEPDPYTWRVDDEWLQEQALARIGDFGRLLADLTPDNVNYELDAHATAEQEEAFASAIGDVLEVRFKHAFGDDMPVRKRVLDLLTELLLGAGDGEKDDEGDQMMSSSGPDATTGDTDDEPEGPDDDIFWSQPAAPAAKPGDAPAADPAPTPPLIPASDLSPVDILRTLETHAFLERCGTITAEMLESVATKPIAPALFLRGQDLALNALTPTVLEKIKAAEPDPEFFSAALNEAYLRLFPAVDLVRAEELARKAPPFDAAMAPGQDVERETSEQQTAYRADLAASAVALAMSVAYPSYKELEERGLPPRTRVHEIDLLLSQQEAAAEQLADQITFYESAARSGTYTAELKRIRNELEG